LDADVVLPHVLDAPLDEGVDKRILDVDTRYTSASSPRRRNVLVDSFVKWRIQDMRQYYISVQGTNSAAQLQLSQTVKAALQDEFSKRTVHDVISGERDKIMQVVREKVDEDMKKIGMEIVDVRLKRVDLPQEVSESVYRRMDAERKASRPSFARRASPRRRKSVPKRTASARSSLPGLTATLSASKARATPRRPPSTRARSTRIPSSTPSTAARRLPGRASGTRAM